MNLKSKSDLPISVVYEDDGSLTIMWDESHPVTSFLNDWTEQDFVDCICQAVERSATERNGK